ncbi:MAG: carbohydrate ABC transporter permease [Bacillati bacterium ANGP1]|uniref:Carbohydrate ABC transporter permease n=1 Tax=Candidatus Segetimicrobium genomatis TaxID=2569760 RepID=A0A537J1B5_9BACT|nr:MAG: carbohydrate ABC transporter permease [Terrabacteria group bacterium ANGP1]
MVPLHGRPRPFLGRPRQQSTVVDPRCGPYRCPGTLHRLPARNWCDQRDRGVPPYAGPLSGGDVVRGDRDDLVVDVSARSGCVEHAAASRRTGRAGERVHDGPGDGHLLAHSDLRVAVSGAGGAHPAGVVPQRRVAGDGGVGHARRRVAAAHPLRRAHPEHPRRDPGGRLPVADLGVESLRHRVCRHVRRPGLRHRRPGAIPIHCHVSTAPGGARFRAGHGDLRPGVYHHHPLHGLRAAAVVRMKTRGAPLRALVLGTVAVLSVIYILPVYVMVVTSLKTPLEITQRQYLAPAGNLQFGNFATALRLVAPALLNSSVISVTVTALSVFIGGLGGYFLARFRWPVTKVIFVLLAIALYLPYQAVLIPLVRIMATTKLALTHFGLIFSYLILNVPLASILMATFFFSVPRELEESAQMDGASRLQIFFRIVSVVALPGYASTAILVFIQVWNEFLLALTLVTPYTTTIQVKLNDIKGSYVALYNLQMAAALITVLVPLTFFLFLGKYFIRGILAGALKG